jgi:hypothetical protein
MVEEFLSDAELEYTPNVELQGPFAPVAVDFPVRGRSKSSAVMVLSARLSTAAHAQANEVFRKVHDLATAGAPEQRVALLDDTGGFAQLYRDDDIGRIQLQAQELSSKGSVIESRRVGVELHAQRGLQGLAGEQRGRARPDTLMAAPGAGLLNNQTSAAPSRLYSCLGRRTAPSGASR